MFPANNFEYSSPTSSLSSSDLDTESTGSFFHDRSTTLGTLMGVTFPSIRTPPHPPTMNAATATASVVSISKPRKLKSNIIEKRRRHHGRKWWQFCRDNAKSLSLGDFLEVERRLGDVGLSTGNRVLFAEERVLPTEQTHHSSSGGGRLPVLLTGICSGGG